MSGPALASRHSWVSPGRIASTGRSWPLTRRTAGLSESIDSLALFWTMWPDLPIWTSLNTRVRAVMCCRSGGSRVRSSPTTMAPDSPARIWLSTSEHDEDDAEDEAEEAGWADEVMPGMEAIAPPDDPVHMSWSWYQYVPCGWSAGMARW